MLKYQLKKLVIKPTLACTANCPTCNSRRILHRNALKERQLSFEQWERIFYEAKLLGAETLDISGGEPTLCKYLAELVRAGKKYDWRINLNTNGSLITEALAKKLVDAGLNSVHISLYSHLQEVHDSMRGTSGLWQKAVNAIKIFSQFENADFSVRSQALICRENYQHFIDLLKFHHKIGSSGIALSYLEGDYEKKYLLNKLEIDDFKESQIPGALAFVKSIRYNEKTQKTKAIDTIKNIYSNILLTDSEWSEGRYQPKDKTEKKCSRPKDFTILLANGDVHPCNIVEYTHRPVMGNLFDNSLTRIWMSDKWNNFRENLFEMCEYCPINLYMYIPFDQRIDNSTFVRKLKYTKKKIIRLGLKIKEEAKKTTIPNLDTSQYWEKKRLVDFQNKRLNLLLDFIFKNNIGYKKKYKAAGVVRGDIKTIDDLYKLPIIERDELQNKPEFVNNDLINCDLNTGGSNGVPLKYHESFHSTIIREKAHDRGWTWGGFNQRTMKWAVLKSSERILKQGKCLNLLGVLSPDNLAVNASELIKFKPEHLKGYVNSLYILALYCLENDIKIRGIKSVIPSSENLYEFQRILIEKVFDCPVYEEYCCNDGGACAWECDKHMGLHYYMERAIIEEFEGEMIVTDLWNLAMPFIRYRNGDSVKFLNQSCTCGRELPLIKVRGRKNDLIITKDRIITPTFLMHHGIGLVGPDRIREAKLRAGIRAVQYVQLPGNILEVNIVKNDKYKENEAKELLSVLEKFVKGLEIKINFIEDLEMTAKMKRSFIINKDKEALERFYSGRLSKNVYE